MKVLFASIPQPKNRFVADLKAGIEDHAEVVWDCQEFWDCTGSYDVVHIHEPEYMSLEIESYLDKTDPIPDDLWERLTDCLDYWKQNAVIVNTRHVQEPHVRADDEFKRWYRTVLSYCDGVAHFADFSIDQFKEFYPDFDPIHRIIPHQNYASLPNTSTREEARASFGISEDDVVMLVFGFIKEHEKALIKQAFDAIPQKSKVLLAPGWKIQRRQIAYIRLREWIFKLQTWLATRRKKMRINLGFVEEADVHRYCNAADFLFIPRTNELNSGNITLGFTFGLVVVGKNSADIGELLMETGNPTFEPANPASVREAIIKAVVLSGQGHGVGNSELAFSEYGIDKVARQYCNLYADVMAASGQRD
jgi:hypothetical protein